MSVLDSCETLLSEVDCVVMSGKSSMLSTVRLSTGGNDDDAPAQAADSFTRAGLETDGGTDGQELTWSMVSSTGQTDRETDRHTAKPGSKVCLLKQSQTESFLQFAVNGCFMKLFNTKCRVTVNA